MAQEQPAVDLRSSQINNVKLITLSIALMAFGATIWQGLLPDASSAGLSVLALLVLGGALNLYTLGRLGTLAPNRQGARAQQAQRSFQILVSVTMVTLFGALVLGSINTSVGAMQACMEWPICSMASDFGQLSMAHRILAGLATVLSIVVAIRGRRYSMALAHTSVNWAFGLMLSQNLVGLIQLLIAATGLAIPLIVSQLTHLGLGAAAWGALSMIATIAFRVPLPVAEPRQAVDPEVRTWKHVVKDYVSLTKPGVISLLILTTVAAMYIIPGTSPSLWLVFWTFVGGWMMASGAHSVNCYMDRDIDINMGRTARRPIPSGRIPAWHALVLGIILGVVAFFILTTQVNLMAALLSLAGYFYYVFIYTGWLKRTSTANIVIGGGAGAFPPLVGWAAVTGEISFAAVVLWLIIFYWTPPHFWALALIREKDYARAGVPMLPVVAGEEETIRQILSYSIQMLIITLLPTLQGTFGMAYFVMALALGGWFMYYVFKLKRDADTASAWGLYKFSLLYLALLFIAMVIDRQLFS